MNHIQPFVAALLDESATLDAAHYDDFLAWAHRQHLILCASHWLAKTDPTPEGYRALHHYEERLRTYRTRINDRIQRLHVLNTALNRKQISPLLIKGLCLSHYIHGDIYARDFNDIDLIVRRDEFVKACQVCKCLGGQSEFDDDYQAALYLETHEVRFTFPDGVLVEIKLTTSSILDVYTLQQLRLDPVDIEITHGRYTTLNRESTLILLLLNIWSSMTQEFAKLKIRDVIDVMLFVRHQEADLDVTRLKDKATKAELRSQVTEAITVLKVFCHTLNLPFPRTLEQLDHFVNEDSTHSLKRAMHAIDDNVLSYFECEKQRCHIFHWLTYHQRVRFHSIDHSNSQLTRFYQPYFPVSIELNTTLSQQGLCFDVQCDKSLKTQIGRTLLPYLIIFDEQQPRYRHLLCFQDNTWKILEGQGLSVSTIVEGKSHIAHLKYSGYHTNLLTASRLYYRFFMTKKMNKKQFGILWSQ